MAVDYLTIMQYYKITMRCKSNSHHTSATPTAPIPTAATTLPSQPPTWSADTLIAEDAALEDGAAEVVEPTGVEEDAMTLDPPEVTTAGEVDEGEDEVEEGEPLLWKLKRVSFEGSCGGGPGERDVRCGEDGLREVEDVGRVIGSLDRAQPRITIKTISPP